MKRMINMLDVRLDTDNTAFDGEDGRREVSRILRDLADRIDAAPGPEQHHMLRDCKGNTVGWAHLAMIHWSRRN